MTASTTQIKNRSKSDRMNQTEQVQNLLASLIFMDKASFISFDKGSPFAMNHDKAPASEIREETPAIDSSVPLLSSEPQQIHSIQIDLSELEKIHGSGITHEHHDHIESTELDSSLGYKTVPSSHGWTELYPSFPIHRVMAEFGAVEITDTPFDKTIANNFDWSASAAYTWPQQSYQFYLSAEAYTTQVNASDGDWSSNSGWGQINVGQSLERVHANYSTVNLVDTSGAPIYLREMGFTAAWANGFTGKGVVIADIDTGFDFKNYVLTQGIDFSAYNWNFIDHNNNVQDDNGHGTMTASEMVADPHTGYGVYGAAFDAELMVLKVLDASGKGSVSNVCEAIYYAVDHGADVINMSLGQHYPNLQLLTAMKYAWSHDVVVVAAAGNNGGNSPSYPAAYGQTFSNVIAVGASENSHSGVDLASFSNHAGSTQPYNYVTANGVDLIGFGIDNTLWLWSGTSMAAPLVASQAAILQSADPSLTATQITQAITGSADNLESWLNAIAADSGSLAYTTSAYANAHDINLFESRTVMIQNAFPIEHHY